MLGFHMMNQTARPMLQRCRHNRIGTLCMFAVRNIFSRPGLLRETIAGLAAEGKLPADLAREGDPLGFLIHRDGGAESLTDAAYRFARHEPGMDVVLFGTGNAAHLDANIRSILAPPLPGSGRRAPAPDVRASRRCGLRSPRSRPEGETVSPLGARP